jgi:hypothetical protein
VSMKSTPNLEDSDEKHPPPAWDGKRKKGLEAIRSVNMHQLGMQFVERVLDVWRRHTDDGKAAAPGASLEFLAQIRGWQSEERKKRKAQLLQLNDTHWATSCVGARSKNRRLLHPESTLCERDPGVRRRRMVISSTVSHKV